MNKYLLPVLAVLIGALIVLLLKQKRSLFTKLLLSFSGAFLLALTLFDLLPEVYHHLDAKLTGLYIMFGILLQIILEFFSKGAEHGHIHIHKDNTQFPWLLFISLCIHSFLEGFPIHQHNDMVYGVLIHKIPIATLITSFLVQSNYSKMQIAGFLIFFAAMTPLGTFISNNTSLAEQYIYIINAIVIGIFFHISTVILFESSEGHKFNMSKLLAIIFGVAIAYMI
ncbi:MAG: ZIP family metal transporter [Xanthomarina sp.]|uniref:ZIP family metal transporter n=1 Tax=Xanthomarina TaxID=1868329 RepID=UPI000C6775B0|nr:ZIP family metal transporter [Xanthomarina sp.]MAL21695.1 ZIP family metal transporter [Xanthomarina sp.]MBF62902.1 ZIP family metal transporter [Xanthomarina sp.]HAI19498.1 ZIP family metal transporter [Xanthomarina gelatinilytica]|tara:strand:+ start:3812 stop:4486 length:675 start_codon:yes stop_codon:yes gene_type:complete